MRRCQKLPPMVDRAVPGSFKDPPLTKAEPVNDIGSMSVITYLRKGKKPLHRSCDRKVRKYEKNNPADTQVSENQEEEVVWVLELRFPYSL